MFVPTCWIEGLATHGEGQGALGGAAADVVTEPPEIPRITRDVRWWLRGLVAAGGAKVHPGMTYWYRCVQTMLALGLVQWVRQNTTHGVMELTELGRLALADADKRAASDAGKPLTVIPQ